MARGLRIALFAAAFVAVSVTAALAWELVDEYVPRGPAERIANVLVWIGATGILVLLGKRWLGERGSTTRE